MNLKEFKQNIEAKHLPQNTPILLQALWHDAQGDWEKAHSIAQSKEGELQFDKLHAYLHRKEGDKFNANYWYRRCHLSYPKISLEEEWEYLFQELANFYSNKH